MICEVEVLYSAAMNNDSNYIAFRTSSQNTHQFSSLVEYNFMSLIAIVL